jgi:hypothetical protein
MENIFINAAFISTIFLIMKFFEMRIVEKENKPLKFLVRDTLLVYFAVLTCYFLSKQFTTIIHTNKNSPEIFTDNPNF